MADHTPPKAHGVARIWRGQTSRDNADFYNMYMYEHGVKKLESLGARGVQFFREDRADLTEFMMISLSDNLTGMTRFAGTDPRKIGHLDRDAELLIALPDHVQILDVFSNRFFLSDALR